MFDITSSKLLLLGIVALLVIGPKDFPALLRTIGKYVGIIRGHAKEFRAQFDEAMRESELAQLKKDVENIAHETEASFDTAGRSVEQTLEDARQTIDGSAGATPLPAPDPPAQDSQAAATPPPQPAPTAVAGNGADKPPHEAPAAAADEAPAAGRSEPAPAAERSRA